MLLTLASGPALAQYPAGPQIQRDGTALVLQNFATLPLSSRTTTTYPPAINYASQLGRVNFLRSEPTNAPLAAARFFVCDQNRNLYLLDKATRSFTTYINFEEVFPRFDNDPGYAGGLVTFVFDPAYATNGIFYTVHTEDPFKSASALPVNSSLPGLDTNGYTVTTVYNPPAGSSFPRQSVLIEWRDTNTANGTFEGTAREILRVGFNSNIHPLGDLAFNPAAGTGEDYRNLYIANGDGGAGEINGPEHELPQRLDSFAGKILRLTPDTSLRPGDELSENGRYRIPSSGTNANPFVLLSLPGLRKEIFAYGFRNPHRLFWDPVANKLIVNDIGLRSWEEVNIVQKGSNYGYAEREGPEQLFVGGANNWKTGSQIVPAVPFPNPDTLLVTGLVTTVTPVYPVAVYSHLDGDAISSGFVYRGNRLPELRGKYVFGDITTGRLFYADFNEMIASDDGNRNTTAVVRELDVVFDSPGDVPDLGLRRRRVFDIVAEEYARRGGNAGSNVLPGGATRTAGNDPEGVPYGGGRSDIRLAQDSDGELYLLSKSDGMIRQFTGVARPEATAIGLSNEVARVDWNSVRGVRYRVEFKTGLDATNWSALPGDVLATNSAAAKFDSVTNKTRRFYRIRPVP